MISSDFAPEMVEIARASGQGRDNLEYRVLDAERMALEGDSVDGVGCRYGYMLMADPGAALRETRRVLRDDGRLAFAVWSTPERNPWVAIPAMTLVQRGHVPPTEPGAPGAFALGMPERIRELVSGRASRTRRSRRSSSPSATPTTTTCGTRSWASPARSRAR